MIFKNGKKTCAAGTTIHLSDQSVEAAYRVQVGVGLVWPWQLCSPATRPPPGGGWPENFQVTNRQEQFHNRTLCVCAYRTQVRVGKATTALGTADAGGGYWYPLPTLMQGYVSADLRRAQVKLSSHARQGYFASAGEEHG